MNQPFQSLASNEDEELEEMKIRYQHAQKQRLGKVPAIASHSYQSLPISYNIKSAGNETRSTPLTTIPTFLQPESCASSSNLNGTVSSHLDMQVRNSISSQRLLVRHCVRSQLFRRIKFFNKDKHGMFDHRNGTVCAMIMHHCNMSEEQATLTWWADMRKLVVRTHTDHRNNVIKTIRLRFRGMSMHLSFQLICFS